MAGYRAEDGERERNSKRTERGRLVERKKRFTSTNPLGSEDNLPVFFLLSRIIPFSSLDYTDLGEVPQ